MELDYKLLLATSAEKVPRIKHWSRGRAASALNRGATSPALGIFLTQILTLSRLFPK